MPQISFSGAFNAAALVVPDLYVNALPPPGVIGPAPYGLLGLEGFASWGPVNKATPMTSSLALFGNPVVRQWDLVTHAQVVSQAQQAAGVGGNLYLERVTDGTDTAATGDVGSSVAATETATIGGTLTLNDILQIIFTSAGISGSPVTIGYTAKSGDTPATMAAGLAALVEANAALEDASVSAIAVGNALTILYPSSLSIAFTKNVTGGGTETITLAAGAASIVFGLGLTSIYTGSGGNKCSWSLSSGSNSTTGTPTWRLTLQQPNFPAEIYDNIGAGLTYEALWAAMANAVNNGNSPIRGPSQLVIATAGTSAATPTNSTGTLSGGTDGATTISSSTMIGSDTSPRSGIYAFRGLGLTDLVIADFDDPTQETDLWEFGQSEGIYVHTSGPPGETPTAGVSAKQNSGLLLALAQALARRLGQLERRIQQRPAPARPGDLRGSCALHAAAAAVLP